MVEDSSCESFANVVNMSAFDQRRNTLKGFKDFYLEAKAIIWP